MPRSWRPSVSQSERSGKKILRVVAGSMLLLCTGLLLLLLVSNGVTQPPMQFVMVETLPFPDSASGTVSALQPQAHGADRLFDFFTRQHDGLPDQYPVPLRGTWSQVSAKLSSSTVSTSHLVYVRTVVRSQADSKADSTGPELWLGASGWKPLGELLGELQRPDLATQSVLLLEVADLPLADAADELQAGLQQDPWDAMQKVVRKCDAQAGRVRLFVGCSAGERCWEEQPSGTPSKDGSQDTTGLPHNFGHAASGTIFQHVLAEELQTSDRDVQSLFEKVRNSVSTRAKKLWQDSQTVELFEPENYTVASAGHNDWLLMRERIPEPAPPAEAAGDKAASQSREVAGAAAPPSSSAPASSPAERLQALLKLQLQRYRAQDGSQSLWLDDQRLFSLALRIYGQAGQPIDVRAVDLQFRELESRLTGGASVSASDSADPDSVSILQRLAIFEDGIETSKAENLLNDLLSQDKFASELSVEVAPFLDWSVRRLLDSETPQQSRPDVLRNLSRLLRHPRWAAPDVAGRLPIWWPLLLRVAANAEDSVTGWERVQAFLRLERNRREVCRLILGCQPDQLRRTPLPPELVADLAWRNGDDKMDLCLRLVRLLTAGESWLGYAQAAGLSNVNRCCDDAEPLLKTLTQRAADQKRFLEARRLQQNEVPWLLRYFCQAAIETDILPINLNRLNVLVTPVTEQNWREFETAREQLRQHLRKTAVESLSARHWRWLCLLPIWDISELEQLRQQSVSQFNNWTHSAEESARRITKSRQLWGNFLKSVTLVDQPARPSVRGETSVRRLQREFFDLRTMLEWEQQLLPGVLRSPAASELQFSRWKGIRQALQDQHPEDAEQIAVSVPALGQDARYVIIPVGGKHRLAQGDRLLSGIADLPAAAAADFRENQLLLVRQGPALNTAATVSMLLGIRGSADEAVPTLVLCSEVEVRPKSEYRWSVRLRRPQEAELLGSQGTSAWRLPLLRSTKPWLFTAELAKTAGPELQQARVRIRGLSRESGELQETDWTKPIEITLAAADDRGEQNGRMPLAMGTSLDVSDRIELEITALAPDGSVSGAAVVQRIEPYFPPLSGSDQPGVELLTEPDFRLQVTAPAATNGVRVAFSPQLESWISPAALQAQSPLKTYELKNFADRETGALYEVAALCPPQQWLWQIDAQGRMQEVAAGGRAIRLQLPTPLRAERVLLQRRILTDSNPEYVYRDAAAKAADVPLQVGPLSLIPLVQLPGFVEDGSTCQLDMKLTRMEAEAEPVVTEFSKQFTRPCRQRVALTAGEDGLWQLAAAAELWNWPDQPLELPEPGRYRVAATVLMDDTRVCDCSVDVIWDPSPPAAFRVDVSQESAQPGQPPLFRIRDLRDDESGLQQLRVYTGSEDEQGLLLPSKFGRGQQSDELLEWRPDPQTWQRIQEQAQAQDGRLSLRFELKNNTGHVREIKLPPWKPSGAMLPAAEAPGPNSVVVNLPPGGGWRVTLEKRGSPVKTRTVQPTEPRAVVFGKLEKTTYKLIVTDDRGVERMQKTIRGDQISDDGPLEVSVSD
jgi:hypothetical protein